MLEDVDLSCPAPRVWESVGNCKRHRRLEIGRREDSPEKIDDMLDKLYLAAW